MRRLLRKLRTFARLLWRYTVRFDPLCLRVGDNTLWVPSHSGMLEAFRAIAEGRSSFCFARAYRCGDLVVVDWTNLWIFHDPAEFEIVGTVPTWTRRR